MTGAIMNPSPSPLSSRNGRVSFGAHGATHSLLLERAKANTNRRPTPDSEVMMSSDDEHSGGQVPPGLRRASTSKPGSSWLSDIGQQPQGGRKYSIGGLSMGSNNSQPPTPSTESTPRLTTTNQGNRAGSVTFAGNIWSSADRNSANRFNDTPHSPLSLAPLSSDPSQASRDRRYSGIGVDIPLKPTFKPQQQRAMSFSVTQQVPSDDEESAHPLNLQRVRTGGHSTSVQRKASLSQVREDEDDDQGAKSLHDMDAGGSQNLLKRAIRHRTFSTNVPGYLDSPWGNAPRRSSTLPVAEDAIEEPEDIVTLPTMPESRRHSLAHVAARSHGPPTTSSLNTSRAAIELEPHPLPPPSPEYSFNVQPSTSATTAEYFPPTMNQDYENMARNFKAQAYNNLIADADVGYGQQFRPFRPTYPDREAAAAAAVQYLKHPYGRETGDEGVIYPLQRQLKTIADPVQFTKPRQAHPDHGYVLKTLTYAIGYFDGTGPLSRIHNEPEMDELDVEPEGNAQEHDASRFHQDEPKTYHLIKFKCERAEIYTIPNNTGLRIEKGQLVIVEGDRGYDIGEVEQANVDLSEIKALRQKYQEKHFLWLMMFSRARESNPTVRWAVSNLDPHNASVRHPDNEIEAEGRTQNFKLIKRLAIPVEFASLQEKEGDETKAKRICQQKVLEHGLSMEILDAEFQLDRHKLTYYYFAEKYVNFNELVNDLFKIFKTRIWMSAVNPASFAPQGHHRGHGPSQQASQVAPYGAAAYANKSTLEHVRLMQQARHEVETGAFTTQFPAMNTNMIYTTPADNANFAASGFGRPTSRTPFNPFAPPYVNPAWNTPTTSAGPSRSSPWGAGSSSFPATAGPSNTGFVGSPRIAQEPPRPRQRSTEDNRNEATRAAFYSAVTGGMSNLSFGNAKGKGVGK